MLEPRLVTPIHYDDYEAFESPLEDFLEATRAAGVGDRIRPIARGETHLLPADAVPAT